MILMGTGSRSVTLLIGEEADALRNKTIKKIKELKPDKIISGMAEGWDELIAYCAIDLSIPLIAAIPNEGYGKYYWENKSLQKRNRMSEFNGILSKTEQIVYVCNTLYVKGIHSNFVRNQWMVDHSDAALIYDIGSRGTKDAVIRLKKADKPYYIINKENPCNQLKLNL